jgi:hypothetical protein
MGTAQALVTAHNGDACATFHKMVELGKGNNILSCLQMEACDADINKHLCSLPDGKQLSLINGYQHPFGIHEWFTLLYFNQSGTYFRTSPTLIEMQKYIVSLVVQKPKNCVLH